MGKLGDETELWKVGALGDVEKLWKVVELCNVGELWQVEDLGEGVEGSARYGNCGR